MSVIFLEPEQVQSMAGRVLAYGVNVFTEGAPQIIGSQNIIQFTDPLTNDIKKLNAQPAQVAVGDTLSFLGTGFNGIQDVLITNAHWSKSGVIPINDPNWLIKVTGGDTLSLKIFDTINLIEETPLPPHLIPKKILPGMYAAQIRVTRKFKLPNGDERAVEHLSNQFPFIVTPKIGHVSIPLADGKITITGGVFQDTDLPDTAVQVYVGNQRYIKNSSGDRGTFDIVDSATLNLTLENGLTSGKYLPLRVIISGAESAPNWIKVP